MNKLILILLLVFAGQLGFAQVDINEFSLNEAVNYGLSNNTSFKNAQLDGAIQRSRAFEVMTEGFPQISAKLDYNFNFEQQVNIIPAGSFGPTQTQEVEAIFQQPQSATLQAEVQQLVFDARYIYGIKAVQGFYDMADAQVELGRINAVEQITKAYYTAAVAAEAYNKLATNEAVLTELLRETTITYQEGLTDELSVNRLELNLANLQTQIAKAKQQSENALMNLKFTMGMPTDEVLDITDDINSLFTGIESGENAVANPEDRIENKILSTQYDIQLYDVKQARSNYFPSVYVLFCFCCI